MRAEEPAMFLVLEVAKSTATMDARMRMMALGAVERAAGVPEGQREMHTAALSELTGRENTATVEVSYREEIREDANARMLGVGGHGGAVRVGAGMVAARWEVVLKMGREVAQTAAQETAPEEVTVTVVVYPALEEDEEEGEQHGLGGELPKEEAEAAYASGEVQAVAPLEAKAQRTKDTHQRIKMVVRVLGRLDVGHAMKRDSQLEGYMSSIIKDLTVSMYTRPSTHAPRQTHQCTCDHAHAPMYMHTCA
jgi:hypothetical protein